MGKIDTAIISCRLPACLPACLGEEKEMGERRKDGRNVLTRKLPLSVTATDANWGVDDGSGGAGKRKHTHSGGGGSGSSAHIWKEGRRENHDGLAG